MLIDTCVSPVTVIGEPLTCSAMRKYGEPKSCKPQKWRLVTRMFV